MNELFHAFSLFFVLSGLICAVIIGLDVLSGRKQAMPVMNAVWPLTGLWGSWLGLAAYLKFGRAQRAGMTGIMKPLSASTNVVHANTAETTQTAAHSDTMRQAMTVQLSAHKTPTFRQITLSTLHCGAGCTLADLAGEWLTFFIPFALFGSVLIGQWTLDYILALLFGLYFQFAAIRSMRKISAGNALKTAFKADFLSLTSWQAGMYGLMAVLMFAHFRTVFLQRPLGNFGFACSCPWQPDL